MDKTPQGEPIKVELFALLSAEKLRNSDTERPSGTNQSETGTSKAEATHADNINADAVLEFRRQESSNSNKAAVKPRPPVRRPRPAAEKEAAAAAIPPVKTVSLLEALTASDSFQAASSPTAQAAVRAAVRCGAAMANEPLLLQRAATIELSLTDAAPSVAADTASDAAAAADAAATDAAARGTAADAVPVDFLATDLSAADAWQGAVAAASLAVADESALPPPSAAEVSRKPRAPMEFCNGIGRIRSRHAFTDKKCKNGAAKTKVGASGHQRALDADSVAGADAGAGTSSSGLNSIVERLSNTTEMGGFDFFVDKSSIEAGYVECAKCKQIFSDTGKIDGRYEVRVLPCFHSVCGPCLESALATCSGEGLECPICSRSYKKRALHDFLPNFEVLSSIEREMIEEIDFTCEECILGNRAEIYCGHCVMNLCKPCSEQHRRAKATARHNLVSLMEQDKRVPLENSHRAQFCATHRTRRFEYYCEDCDSLICYLCCLEAHQSHNYKLPSSSLVAKHRKIIEDVLEKLNWRMHESQELQKQTNIMLTDVESATSHVHAEAELCFGQLKSATEHRCSELKRTLADKYSDHRRMLDNRRDECSTALVDIWRTIDFLEKVIDRATNIEVLKLKEHVFQDRNQLRQWQRWNEVSQRSSKSGTLRCAVSADWRSSSESEDLLEKIKTFGYLESTPHALLMEIMSQTDDQDSENARLPPVTLSPPGLTEQAPSCRLTSSSISLAGESEETDCSDIFLRWMRMPPSGQDQTMKKVRRRRETPGWKPRRSWAEYMDDSSSP